MDKDTRDGADKPESVEDALTELLRKGAQELIRQAVEAELADMLAQYEHRTDPQGRAGVVRNGHLPEREVLTGLGSVRVRVPKVRSRTSEPATFHSILVPPYVRRARTLEVALPWLYLKGISTGQMQEALEVLVGPGAKGLSPSVVSRLKRQWQAEYAAWRRRRLDGDRWLYWWVDGVYSGLRAERQRLCMLVIIGLNDRGEKHFLAIEDGVRESTQSWREVLLDLKARGLQEAPQVAVGDGALGFWAALDEVFPSTHHQRCWVHKTVNVLNYLPKIVQPKAKAALHDIWMAPTKAEAEQALDHFAETYEPKYPKAVHCLVKDREALLTFYHFPKEHWVHLRTTNPVESIFSGVRLRTDAAKRLRRQDNALYLVFKIVERLSGHWRTLNGGANLMALVLAGCSFKDGLLQRRDVRQLVAAVA